jgi:hypothetical protein
MFIPTFNTASTRAALLLLGTTVLGSAGLGLADARAAAQPTTDSDKVPITWQHHKATFNYSGITTLYTCDGLEGQVRRILRYLGARVDLKINVTGCPRGPDSPGRNAWIEAEFDVPATATDQPSADTATGAWVDVDMTPQHPLFMDAGDCELVQDMKDVVTKNFNIRHLDYRTSCYPNELSFDAFAVKGQALHAKDKP